MGRLRLYLIRPLSTWTMESGQKQSRSWRWPLIFRTCQLNFRAYTLALFKSPSGGGLTKWGQLLSEVHWTLLFCSLKLLGPGDLRKQVCLGPKTLHYAKFWAQNAAKTSAGNIPESLSNLFLRDNCCLLQRLLNNANLYHATGYVYITVIVVPGIHFGITLHSLYCKYFSAETILLYITFFDPNP